MEMQCYEIFRNCFKEFTLDFESFKRLTFRKGIKILTKKVDDKIVGYIIYYKNRINLLCVDPSFQNQGIGSELLAKAEEDITSTNEYKDIVLGRSKILLASVCTKDEYYERKGAHFFKRRGYTSLGYCEEMSLDLSKYDINKTKYNHDIEGVSFDFFKGSKEDLLAAVALVDKAWLDCFDSPECIYVAMKDDKVVSFCNITVGDVTKLTNENSLVGNVGCVGTIPSARKQGIGLTLVAKATEILKERGVNIAHIHYTGVAPWYRKLGYETYIYYWFAHKKINN